MLDSILESLRLRIVFALGGVLPPRPDTPVDMGFDVEYLDRPAERKATHYTNEIHHIERGHVRKLHFADNLALPEHTGVL